ILYGALAYFIMPIDLVPDFIAWIGFTDDAAVLYAALRTVAPHIKDQHRRQAQTAIDKLAGAARSSIGRPPPPPLPPPGRGGCRAKRSEASRTAIGDSARRSGSIAPSTAKRERVAATPSCYARRCASRWAM